MNIEYPSINADIEDNEEEEWYDAMSEEVEVDEVHLDVERVESEGSGAYPLNHLTIIKCASVINSMIKNITGVIFVQISPGTCTSHNIFTLHSQLKKLWDVVNDGKGETWKNVD